MRVFSKGTIIYISNILLSLWSELNFRLCLQQKSFQSLHKSSLAEQKKK